MSEVPAPNPDQSVYFLTDNGVNLASGSIVATTGPNVHVLEHREDPKDGDHTIVMHRTDVFSATQVGVAADELLATPPDGEEKLLDTAIKEAATDPRRSAELTLRLAGLAMGERMNSPRVEADFGVRSVEDIIGNVEKYGSNMWKVEDMIDLSKTNTEATNEITLARPNEQELALLTMGESDPIRTQIAETSRKALDALYDKYDVSFANATVFERIAPTGHERVTVYPSATENISFVERVMDSDSALEDAKKVPYTIVQTGTPTLSPEDGYSPAI